MKRVIVTPAGRRRYVELLAGHLAAQRDSFDEWHIWLNTTDADDIACLRKQDAVIVEAPDSRPHEGCHNIFRFFPVDSCEPGTLYLRLDDDVVWLEPRFVDSMFSFREREKEPMCVFANIVNNAICSHLHWRLGQVDFCGYACMDGIGWSNGGYAEHVHRQFLAASDIEAWKFPRWGLRHHERCSINAIAWSGDTFSKFGGRIEQNEESCLTEHAPREWGANVIYGRALCAHFAFGPQRGHMDQTDILELYRKKLEEQCPKVKLPLSSPPAVTSKSILSWLRGTSSSDSTTPQS